MNESAPSRGEVLWAPGADAWTATAAGRFARRHGFERYDDLHRWSTTELEEFWTAVADDRQVSWRARPSQALAGGDRSVPGARWFPDGELSYAEHALRAAADRPARVAVVARSQTRGPVELTGGQLVEAVARAAGGLRRLGVARGDRVAAYAPNIPETLIAFLAAASIGAVWTSCAPEFGTRSVIDRLSQLDPTVLLVVDGYRYGAKDITRTAEVAAIRTALPSVHHVVSIPYLGGGVPDSTSWDDLLAGPDPGPPVFEGLPFDHPLYVLFSSGTTGLPKAIVHGHGGITLEHLKVLALHQDLGPEDRFAWFTTTGWMMWNYLVSGLLVGSTIVLFDGDPGHPDLGTLWRLAADTGCTVFGTSAPFIMASRKAGLEPPRGQLRWVGSTGAPLPASGFRWVDERLGVPVSSISGAPTSAPPSSAALLSCPCAPVRSPARSSAARWRPTTPPGTRCRRAPPESS
jgi:acetoacetyl-CoA synthetase